MIRRFRLHKIAITTLAMLVIFDFAISQVPARAFMSAFRVTERVLRGIDDAETDVFIVNFADPDMVGHTGKRIPYRSI